MKNKPYLLVTAGLPGSGKTTFAKKFSKENFYIHLNSHIIRQELARNTKKKNTERNLFLLMHKRTQVALQKGRSVIYDSTGGAENFRESLKNIALKNRAQYRTLWFKSTAPQSVKRVQLRNYKPGRFNTILNDDVIKRVKKEFEKPNKNKETIVLTSGMNYNQQKRIVNMAL